MSETGGSGGASGGGATVTPAGETVVAFTAHQSRAGLGAHAEFRAIAKLMRREKA